MTGFFEIATLLVQGLFVFEPAGPLAVLSLAGSLTIFFGGCPRLSLAANFLLAGLQAASLVEPTVSDFIVLLRVLYALGLVLYVLGEIFMPVGKLPKPVGSHSVATYTEHIDDTTTGLEFNLRLYYPANLTKRSRLAPYLSHGVQTAAAYAKFIGVPPLLCVVVVEAVISLVDLIAVFEP